MAARRTNADPASALETFYFLNDHLGTPQKLIDLQGTPVWEGRASAFGEIQVQAGNGVENNLRFPGQYFDRETNLAQNWRRDYKSATGRYLQSDPIGLQGGINSYAYVGGNPLTAFDPLGLCECRGKARVFQGNSRLIGKGGGFDTNTSNKDLYGITADSSAVIPAQFGLSKSQMRNIINQISGTLSDGTTFSRVRDVMDDAGARNRLNMTTSEFQQYLINREALEGAPLLMLELPGASKDLGIQNVIINMPDGYRYPQGTQLKSHDCSKPSAINGNVALHGSREERGGSMPR